MKILDFIINHAMYFVCVSLTGIATLDHKIDVAVIFALLGILYYVYRIYDKLIEEKEGVKGE